MFRKEGSASSRRGRSDDGALRKSDRRRLRDRALASFPLLVGSSKGHVKAENTTDEDDDGDASEATALRILDDALCVRVGGGGSDGGLGGRGGELIGRRLRFGDAGGSCPATLYLRTPSPQSSGDDDNNDVAVARWPYRETTQPVLLEFGRGRGRANDGGHDRLLLVPCPALLSVMPVSLMLPQVVVRPGVSRYLCRGADLMRSGIVQILPLDPDQRRDVGADSGPGLPRRGDVVAVLVRGNPQPFGVGLLAEDAASVPFGPGTKGVAVRMLYCYGDDLWRVQLPHSSPPGRSAASRPQPIPRAGAVGRNWDDGNYGNAGFVDGVAVKALTPTSPDDGKEGDDHGKAHPSQGNTHPENVDPTAVGDSSSDVSSGNEETHGEEAGTTALVGGASAGNGDPLEDEDVDDDDALLLRCFHTALKTTVTKSLLPMPVSTFFAGHLLPARPAGTTLNMKKTRHGKLGPFLLEQADLGVISLSPSRDGRDKTAFISEVHQSHPDLWPKKKMLKEEDGDEAATSTGMKKVVNLYRVPQQVTTGMGLDDDAVSAAGARAEERRGTGFLTSVECNAILSNYVHRHDLIDPTDPSCVMIDGPLSDALWGHSREEVQEGGSKSAALSPYPTRASRRELRDWWFARMEPAHALVVMATNQVISIERGEPSAILIEVKRRGGRKQNRTWIRGLEAYGIDGTEFASDVSKRFGCAATVESGPRKGRAALEKGKVEVVLQGNLMQELKALLTGDEKLSPHGGCKGGEYVVPKNVIEEKFGKGVAQKRQ